MKKFLLSICLVLGIIVSNAQSTIPRWGSGKTSVSATSVGPRITYNFVSGLDTLKISPNSFIVPIYVGVLSDSLLITPISLTGCRLGDEIVMYLFNSADGGPTRKIKLRTTLFSRPTNTSSISFISGMATQFYFTIPSGQLATLKWVFNGTRYSFVGGSLITP